VNQYDKQNVYQQTSQSKIPSKRAKNTNVELDRIVRLKSAGTEIDKNYIGIPRLKSAETKIDKNYIGIPGLKSTETKVDNTKIDKNYIGIPRLKSTETKVDNKAELDSLGRIVRLK
jgi:glutaredoxin-related protein